MDLDEDEDSSVYVPNDDSQDSFFQSIYLFNSLWFLCNLKTDFMIASEQDWIDATAQLISHKPNAKGNYPSYGRSACTTLILHSRKQRYKDNFKSMGVLDCNPGSYNGTCVVMDKMISFLDYSGNYWTYSVSDGSPFLRQRIEQIMHANLSSTNSEKKLYSERIIILVGFLHEEMTMLTSLMELFDAIGILDPIVQLFRKRVGSKATLLKTGTDTHKKRTVAFLVYIALKNMAESIGILSDNGWKENLTPFESMLRDVVSVCCAFEVFMMGVRYCNTELILLGRKLFYPLYFVFNHYQYARIVADDTAHIEFLKEHCPILLVERMKAALVNMSGVEGMYQGSDAIQEEINRDIIRILGHSTTVSRYTQCIFHSYSNLLQSEAWKRAGILWNVLAELTLDMSILLGMEKNKYYARAVHIPEDDIEDLRIKFSDWASNCIATGKSLTYNGNEFKEDGLRFYSIGKERSKQYISQYYSQCPHPSAIQIEREWKFDVFDFHTNTTPGNEVKQFETDQLMKAFLKDFQGGVGAKRYRSDRVQEVINVLTDPHYIPKVIATDNILSPNAKKAAICAKCQQLRKGHICAPVVRRNRGKVEAWKEYIGPMREPDTVDEDSDLEEYYLFCDDQE